MTTPHFPEADEGPLSDRELAIRALHQFADWLTAHPETPAPDHIDARTHAGDAAEVAVWADATGARRDFVQQLTRVDLLVLEDFG